MATMLSSPIGPSLGNAKYDLFDQPSSPTFKHDDLPAEFGDQSFGSSMSLGSSFELHRLTASGSSSSQLSIYAAQNRAKEDPAPTIRMPARRSPPRTGQDSLGAAMGTVLNSRSPGLAAKMSSVDYMDMSSPPAKHNAATPPKNYSADNEHQLPPGSAMKEDTPVQQSYASRRSASETTTTTGGSLGLLFGTELSINSRHHSFQSGVLNKSFAFQASPDKEPPAKRRPSSLPLQEASVPARSSQRSGGMGPPSSSSAASSRRPSLMKSMTANQSVEAKSARRGSAEPIRQLQRASESMVPTAKSFTTMPVPRRARSGSSDGSDLRDFSQLQRPSLPPLHPTIIESPSPNSLQAHEDFGNYFFDPQSPHHPQPSSHRNSISSNLAPDSNARPRTFQKSATLAIVPSTLSAANSGSSLGKRGNPYAKRPSLGVLPAPPLSAHAYAAGCSESNAYYASRITAPAPRRRHSAMDNSAAFAQAAEDLSMHSVDHGDSSEITSPSDNRGKTTSANRMFPPDFDASGSPIAPTSRPKSRPSMLRMPSKDDSSPLGYGSFAKRLAVKNAESAIPATATGDESACSPYRSAEGLPGFGASEREGKILPCFNIKDDGLMRIKPSTLIEVMGGIYNHQMDGFQVVDCRFGYEFEGGHIAGAINLSTVEAVINHFLHPDGPQKLPLRSQSGKPDSSGVWKKKVLIFHCEFSAKRAPSMALALRQADRGLVHDYPNCHYPEVYILEGGYCGFFKQYDSVCEPRFYIQMDDPKFLDKRSKELNGFRKTFSRHRSFAFGDTISNASRQLASEGTLVNNPSFGRTYSKEESSFDNSSASPSAVQADVALARRKLTKGVSNPSRLENNTFKGIGIKPAIGSAPVTVGDLSFGCSSFGDSSFEGGPSDSPSAAAAANRRPSAVFLKAGKEAASAFNSATRGTGSSLGRHSFQRASTAAHIQMR